MTEVPIDRNLCARRGRIFKAARAGRYAPRRRSRFQTSLPGYQEVFTDPSYGGPDCLPDDPHIGTVGANLDDEDHAAVQRSLLCENFAGCSKWRAAESAQLYLNRHKIARYLGCGYAGAGCATSVRSGRVRGHWARTAAAINLFMKRNSCR